jgi:hypothetical protein
MADISSLCGKLLNRLLPMGGHAGVLDDRAIVLSWNHLSGLVVFLPDGTFALKVSTPWGDADQETAERSDDIPDKIVHLFEGFWARRGVKFEE